MPRFDERADPVIPRQLRQGSLASILCRILFIRRYKPIRVAQLSQIAKRGPRMVSNALQLLQRLGAARRVGRGWCYRKQDRG